MKKLLVFFLVFTGLLFTQKAEARIDVQLTNPIPDHIMVVYGSGNEPITCNVNTAGHKENKKSFSTGETCHFLVYPYTLRVELYKNGNGEEYVREPVAVSYVEIEERHPSSWNSRSQKVTITVRSRTNIPSGKTSRKVTKRTSRGHQGVLKLDYFNITGYINLILDEESFYWFPQEDVVKQDQK